MTFNCWRKSLASELQCRRSIHSYITAHRQHPIVLIITLKPEWPLIRHQDSHHGCMRSSCNEHGQMKITHLLHMKKVNKTLTLCSPWERCKRAVCAPWKRCSNVMDAIKTLWERRVNAVWTLLGRCVHAITGNFEIFRRISRRHNRALSERYTNAVASLYGVTGALGSRPQQPYT